MFFLKQYNKTLLQFDIEEDAMPDDLENIEKYAKMRRYSYGVPFENIVKEFITPRQKAKLRQMIGFHFERDKNYNLSAKRMNKIENYLQIRTAELLNI